VYISIVMTLPSPELVFFLIVILTNLHRGFV
jgi:hypothetical protein